MTHIFIRLDSVNKELARMAPRPRRNFHRAPTHVSVCDDTNVWVYGDDLVAFTRKHGDGDHGEKDDVARRLVAIKFEGRSMTRSRTTASTYFGVALSDSTKPI